MRQLEKEKLKKKLGNQMKQSKNERGGIVKRERGKSEGDPDRKRDGLL